MASTPGALLDLVPELLAPKDIAKLICAAQLYEHLGHRRLRELARQIVLAKASGDLCGDEALRLMRRHGVALLTRFKGERAPIESIEVLQEKLTRPSPIVVASVEAEHTARITYTMHMSRGDVRIIFRVSGPFEGSKGLSVTYEARRIGRQQALSPILSLRLNVNVVIFCDQDAEIFEFIPAPEQSSVLFSPSLGAHEAPGSTLFALQVTALGAY